MNDDEFAYHGGALLRKVFAAPKVIGDNKSSLLA